MGRTTDEAIRTAIDAMTVEVRPTPFATSTTLTATAGPVTVTKCPHCGGRIPEEKP